MPRDRRLPVALPAATSWEVCCPTCGHPIEDLPMEETNAGSLIAEGPDRFPVCDECGEQFEVGEVYVAPMDPTHAT